MSLSGRFGGSDRGRKRPLATQQRRGKDEALGSAAVRSESAVEWPAITTDKKKIGLARPSPPSCG